VNISESQQAFNNNKKSSTKLKTHL